MHIDSQAAYKLILHRLTLPTYEWQMGVLKEDADLMGNCYPRKESSSCHLSIGGGRFKHRFR